MRKDDIQVFVDGAINYFATISDTPAQVGSPYLLSSLSDSVFEYTGIIGIAGVYSGNVLFSAPSAMIVSLLNCYKGVSFDNELLLDLVGEIANTISGNAREQLGSEFNISPPILSRGLVDEVKTAKGLQTYCIPIVWNDNRANLIVAVV